ncbi:hypothetical protein GHT06_007638 [Daphnia sinensis]|uniref:Uncharacterized protein n=1 Tax=Daphnia sinensis TaxID=1820382 RepID=A0AAD5KFA1_9CRUS|nr:hypothetical protein GHT06_007638 [Daphnia sinensis]
MQFTGAGVLGRCGRWRSCRRGPARGRDRGGGATDVVDTAGRAAVVVPDGFELQRTPAQKRNLIKETQSDSNSLSVYGVFHHKGHDAELSASNIKLPNEIMDYLTKSMVR